MLWSQWTLDLCVHVREVFNYAIVIRKCTFIVLAMLNIPFWCITVFSIYIQITADVFILYFKSRWSIFLLSYNVIKDTFLIWSLVLYVPFLYKCCQNPHNHVIQLQLTSRIIFNRVIANIMFLLYFWSSRRIRWAFLWIKMSKIKSFYWIMPI